MPVLLVSDSCKVLPLPPQEVDHPEVERVPKAFVGLAGPPLTQFATPVPLLACCPEPLIKLVPEPPYVSQPKYPIFPRVKPLANVLILLSFQTIGYI